MKYRVHGIGAGDAVDRAQLSDPVGRAHCGGAFDARIAVGRIGGVELVAAADPTDPWIVADRIVDREGMTVLVITGPSRPAAYS
jgi:hypothetical protein